MDIRRLKASPLRGSEWRYPAPGVPAGGESSWLSVWYSLQKRNLSEEDMNYIDASLIECYGRRGSPLTMPACLRRTA